MKSRLTLTSGIQQDLAENIKTELSFHFLIQSYQSILANFCWIPLFWISTIFTDICRFWKNFPTPGFEPGILGFPVQCSTDRATAAAWILFENLAISAVIFQLNLVEIQIASNIRNSTRTNRKQNCRVILSFFETRVTSHFQLIPVEIQMEINIWNSTRISWICDIIATAASESRPAFS